MARLFIIVILSAGIFAKKSENGRKNTVLLLLARCGFILDSVHFLSFDFSRRQSDDFYGIERNCRHKWYTILCVILLKDALPYFSQWAVLFKSNTRTLLLAVQKKNIASKLC